MSIQLPPILTDFDAPKLRLLYGIVARSPSFRPIFDLARARPDTFAYCPVDPGQSIPINRLRKLDRRTPLVVLRDLYPSKGPTGWDGAAELGAWAKAGFVVARREPGLKTWQSVKLSVSQFGRVLVVVTSSAHDDGWNALLPNPFAGGLR